MERTFFYKLGVFAVVIMIIVNVIIPAIARDAEEIITEGVRYIAEAANEPEIGVDNVDILQPAAELEENLAIYADFVERPAIVETTAPVEEFNFYFDGNVAYQATKTIEVMATAYCHCKDCCGKTPDHEAYGITKSGVDLLAPGADIRVVAADPSILPLGTKIYIEVPEEQRDTLYVTADYGFASVEDTGGAIDGNRIDVYFPTHQEACEWGIRYVQVHVIVPVE